MRFQASKHLETASAAVSTEGGSNALFPKHAERRLPLPLLPQFPLLLSPSLPPVSPLSPPSFWPWLWFWSSRLSASGCPTTGRAPERRSAERLQGQRERTPCPARAPAHGPAQAPAQAPVFPGPPQPRPCPGPAQAQPGRIVADKLDGNLGHHFGPKPLNKEFAIQIIPQQYTAIAKKTEARFEYVLTIFGFMENTQIAQCFLRFK